MQWRTAQKSKHGCMHVKPACLLLADAASSIKILETTQTLFLFNPAITLT